MKSTLLKVWALLPADQKRKALWMLALTMTMAFVELLSVLSLVPFLTVLSNTDAIHNQPILNYVFDFFAFKDDRSFISFIGVASVGIVLFSSAFKTITQHTLNRFVHFLRHSISCNLLTRYLHQPYEFFLNRNSSELSKNVLAEVDRIVGDLIQPLTQLISQGAVVLAMTLLIICYDPIAAIVILITISLLYLLIYTSVRTKLQNIGAEVVNADKIRYQTCSEAFGGIREVKVSHTENIFIQRYSQAARTYARHIATNETISYVPLYLLEAVGYTGLIVLSLYLLHQTNNVSLIVPTIGMYSFAAYRLLPAVQIMYRGFARLRFTSAALDNVYSDIIQKQQQPYLSTEKLQLKNEICLNRIHFHYPSAPDKPIFQNYNLKIAKGTIAGIWGKSGAGKTTLMDLMLGLISPQQGSLCIDGIKIDHTNINAWQNSIGYVPQNIFIADTSIANNIAFGVSDEHVDMKMVIKCAKSAQLHNFISEELQEGYSTLVGDRGIRLSGGQKQRIGIARALYNDPDIILMDEATSALDAETESQINDAIDKIANEKTIILIAHRQSTLERCTHLIQVGQ